MSDRRPLYHLLYTNAPGEGGSGFRFFAVGFPGTKEEQREIEGWLMDLELADKKKIGWAVRSFRVAGSPCFALAVVDPTRFPVDEHERPGGILAHAFLLRIEEGKPVGDFGLAALAIARNFLEERPEPHTLDDYLLGCRVTSDLGIPGLDHNKLRALDASFLEVFYAAACDRRRGETTFFPGCTEEELPRLLLSASTALPPRLRLGLSWRVGLWAGQEGFVARIAEAGSDVRAPKNAGTAYLDAVRAQLREGQEGRVARFAATDWSVRSWSDAIRHDPARKKPEAAPRAKSQTYDEEYLALEKTLRDYFEQRLTQVLAPSPLPSARKDRLPLAFRWYQAWRPEIYFLILLLLGAASHWSLRQAIAPPVSARYDSVAAPSPRPGPSPNPLAEWREFVESPEAVDWFRSIAKNEGLTDRQISSSRRADFSGWADELARGERLTESALIASRIGFFEYAHARWAREHRMDNPLRNVVSLDPSEVAPHLQDLLIDLELTGELGSKSSVYDSEVQAAVALAWVRQHSTP